MDATLVDLLPAAIPFDDWVVREAGAIKKVGVRMSTQDIRCCWYPGCTTTTIATPTGLGRSELLGALSAFGVESDGIDELANPTGEAITLSAGAYDVDLGEIFDLRMARHCPFDATYARRDDWCRARGVRGHSPVEYMLYAVLRYVGADGKLPNIWTILAACNRHNSEQVLDLDISPTGEVSVHLVPIQGKHLRIGAVPWTFTEARPLGVVW